MCVLSIKVWKLIECTSYIYIERESERKREVQIIIVLMYLTNQEPGVFLLLQQSMLILILLFDGILLSIYLYYIDNCMIKAIQCDCTPTKIIIQFQILSLQLEPF